MLREWAWIVAMVLGLSSEAFASEQVSQARGCAHTAESFRCVEFTKNYDGDTFTVNIPSVHPLIGNKITVRVNGIDAPEMDAESACERQTALKAQAEVERLLRSARRVDLLKVSRDKYFRVLAEVQVDGVSLAEHLLRANLAVPYDGGHKDLVNWCQR